MPFMRILVLSFVFSPTLLLQAQQPFFFEDAREDYQTVKVEGKVLSAFTAKAEYLRIDDLHYLYVGTKKTGVYKLQEQVVQTAYLDYRGAKTRMVQKSFKALSPVGAWHFPSAGEAIYPRASAPAMADALRVAQEADELLYYRDKILKIEVDGGIYHRLDDSTFFYYARGKGEGRYRIGQKIDTLYDIHPLSGEEEVNYYKDWYRVGPWVELQQAQGVELQQMGHYKDGKRRGFWRHVVPEDIDRDTLWFHEGAERHAILAENKIFEADTLNAVLPGRWWVWEWSDGLQAVRAKSPPSFAQYEWEIETHGRSRIRRMGENKWHRLRWKVWEEAVGLLELRLQHDYFGNNYQNFWLQEDKMWWFSDKADFLSLLEME